MPVLNNIFTAGIFVFSFFYNSWMGDSDFLSRTESGSVAGRWGRIWTDKRRLLIARKEVLLMILFYLLHIVSAVFSHDKKEAAAMLALRVPLLLFPLSLGLLYIAPSLKKKILLSYVRVTALIALVSLITALAKFIPTGDSVWLYNDSLTDGIRLQSSYFSLAVAVAIFTCVYLLVTGDLHGVQRSSTWTIALFLLVIHFMLASRISMSILYTGLLITAGWYIIRSRRFGLGIVAAVGLAICVLLCLRLFPKTLNRFRELAYPSYNITSVAAEAHYNGVLTPDQWNGENIRLAIWKCGWQVTRQHWLSGVQLGDKQHALMEAYQANGFEFAFRNKRNMHNNYLDIFSCFGIIGLLLFLAGYVVVPVRKAVLPNEAAVQPKKATPHSPDWLGLAIVLTFAVSMFVESYFDRSTGCLMAGFFFSFIAAYK